MAKRKLTEESILINAPWQVRYGDVYLNDCSTYSAIQGGKHDHPSVDKKNEIQERKKLK
jgi:hypothetical protein